MGGGRLYAWSRIGHGQACGHGLGLGEDAEMKNVVARDGLDAANPATTYRKTGRRQMGFLFYANFVRFVLRGGFVIVLVEHARAFVRAARVGAESGQ
jgi:hypothetical protein